ncbi:MAG: GAF domain-containing protein [Alphaproteobacteria bacterium]|nr:GAF domain-containing protein [Alphaproteobacteria bacterium]
MVSIGPEALGRIFEVPFQDSDVTAIRTTLTEGTDPQVVAQVAELLRRFSVLIEVNKTVGKSISLDEMLPHLIEVIAEVLHADRATLFLHDDRSGELFSRVVQGDNVNEIRIRDDSGVAGAVFTTGHTLIIPDAYADTRFSPETDKQTGYRTRNILCVPIRNRDRAVIGIAQVLNKTNGGFSDADATLLDAITTQAAAALEHARFVEELEKAHRDEVIMLEVGGAISGDLDLDSLLEKIMHATTMLTSAERSTLFIHDPETGELWSRVAQGAERKEIRLPSYGGLAGAAFTSGETLNIVDAYADARFDPEFDRQTGFKTRSILCMPLADRLGQPIGVMQVLNKVDGPFTALDETRLKAFSAQAAVALENAKLFQDVLQLKNYNEGILKSLSNGVVTMDSEFVVTKINEAALRILGHLEEDLVGRPVAQVFGNANNWIVKSLDYVSKTGATDYHADADLMREDGSMISVNLTVAPLLDIDANPIGFLLVFEDLTREKRIRVTMSRYLAKEVVDKLLESDEDAFLASSQQATVLFSDIRHFARITETLGADETVHMLNTYFTAMVDVVLRHGGILDKYIGDAIMAVFGAPLVVPRDADNAVAASIEMVRALERFNLQRTSSGLEPIEVGIGISTGDVVAGSIGTTKRMDYTVIGESVNLAARLEGANKHYGTSVLVSDTTISQMKSALSWREIDLMRVTGTNKLVSVFEPLDCYPEAVRANLNRVRGAYQKGVRLYRQRQWNEAPFYFEQVLARCPNDTPSQLYINRCRYYLDEPPGEDWDGVWILH